MRRGAAAAVPLALALLPSACGEAPRDVGERIPFEHRIIDPSPPRGADCCVDVVAAGDVDGDGILDVVVGTEHSGAAGLVWYRGPDWERRPIARGDFTTDGRIADLDGDGDADVVASEMQRGLLWFENHGGARGWTERPLGTGYAHDLVVGDLDGDGRLDVAAADKQGVDLLLRRDEGWSRTRIAEGEGEGLAIADLDADGRPDLLYSSGWLRAPAAGGAGAWTRHAIARRWPAATRTASADLNGDGRPDVVLSAAESEGRLSWFEAPEDPRDGPWREHPIDPGPLLGTHSLQLADVDGDGLLDVVAAEMDGRVSVYARDRRGGWTRDVVSRRGSHNLLAVDLDRDGDVDLLGKRSAGAETPVEWWRNRTGDVLALDRWRYRAIDADRPPTERTKMGLFLADLGGDGLPEVVAGSRIYSLPPRAPGESCPPALGGNWRVESLGDVDLYGAVDVDGDADADLIGMEGDELRWIEADASGWRARRVATVPVGRTQGFATGDVVPGGRPELVFTRGKALHLLEIPEDPTGRPWPVTTIATDSEEEGVALGDLDRDGDLDVATHAADGHHVLWYANPGSATASWERHVLWRSEQWLDRLAIADMDRDGRLDLVFSQESGDWETSCGVFWLAGPADPVAEPWRLHEIVRLRSVNSLSVADMDGDGDLDVVAAEHTDQGTEAGAPDNRTLVLESRDEARRWIPHRVERGGHSSHLGARVGDLDGDGDLDIVSFGWMQYRPIHLWENLAVPPAACGDGRR